MARPRSPVWTRITSKIDLCDAHLIPHLAHEPSENWPQLFKTNPWHWTGATTRDGLPMIKINNSTQSVIRIIYHRLIAPIGPAQRLLSPPDPRDLNPLHYKLQQLERFQMPPAEPDHTPAPAFADSFDLDAVADQLDAMNPRSIANLKPLLEEYYPAQIFEALKKANLAARMGVNSPGDLLQ